MDSCLIHIMFRYVSSGQWFVCIVTDQRSFQGVFYKRNGSLYFSTVDETHNGRYSCTPYNDLGTDGPSPLIQVIVQRPPQFTLKPKPIYMTKLGESLTMTCDATDRDGSHRALIQWTRKDGIALPFARVSFEGMRMMFCVRFFYSAIFFFWFVNSRKQYHNRTNQWNWSRNLPMRCNQWSRFDLYWHWNYDRKRSTATALQFIGQQYGYSYNVTVGTR